MDGSTVNIADFQCRARNSRTFQSTQRLWETTSRAANIQQPGRHGNFHAAASESTDAASVVDISVAWQAHRTTRRPLYTFSVRHRANVLRFTANAAIRQAMRAEEELRAPTMQHPSDGSRDLPPAA